MHSINNLILKSESIGYQAFFAVVKLSGPLPHVPQAACRLILLPWSVLPMAPYPMAVLPKCSRTFCLQSYHLLWDTPPQWPWLTWIFGLGLFFWGDWSVSDPPEAPSSFQPNTFPVWGRQLTSRANEHFYSAFFSVNYVYKKLCRQLLCPSLQNSSWDCRAARVSVLVFTWGEPRSSLFPTAFGCLYAHGISPHYAPIILFFPYRFANLSN